jgi:hypothetical protein
LFFVQVFEMLLHYGFLPPIPLEFFEPSILLEMNNSHPLYELRGSAIAACFPTHDSDWRPIMPKYVIV